VWPVLSVYLGVKMDDKDKPTYGEPFKPSKALKGHGFLMIPNEVAKCDGLTRSAKLLYGKLLQHTGKNDYCWPSVETLAKGLNMTLPTVKRAIYELRDKRLIKRRFSSGQARAQHRTKRTYFLWNGIFEGITSEPPRGSKMIPQGDQKRSPKGIKNDPPIVVNNHLRKKRRGKKGLRPSLLSFSKNTKGLIKKFKRIRTADNSPMKGQVLPVHYEQQYVELAQKELDKIERKSARYHTTKPRDFMKQHCEQGSKLYNVLAEVVQYLWKLKGNYDNDIEELVWHYLLSVYKKINKYDFWDSLCDNYDVDKEFVHPVQVNQLKPTETRRSYFEKEYIPAREEGDMESFWQRKPEPEEDEDDDWIQEELEGYEADEEWNRKAKESLEKRRAEKLQQASKEMGDENEEG